MPPHSELRSSARGCHRTREHGLTQGRWCWECRHWQTPRSPERIWMEPVFPEGPGGVGRKGTWLGKGGGGSQGAVQIPAVTAMLYSLFSSKTSIQESVMSSKYWCFDCWLHLVIDTTKAHVYLSLILHCSRALSFLAGPREWGMPVCSFELFFGRWGFPCTWNYELNCNPLVTQ